MSRLDDDAADDCNLHRVCFAVAYDRLRWFPIEPIAYLAGRCGLFTGPD
jgi:hypothetical protein